MRLVVDIQALQSPNTRRRGIDRYTRNLLAGVAAVRPGWNMELVENGHFEPAGPIAGASRSIQVFRPPLPDHPRNRDGNERYYADWLAAREADAILLTNIFDDRVLVPRFTGPRPRLCGILYDLIPLLYHEEYLKNAKDRAAYANRFRCLLGMDYILSISASSTRDLRALGGDRIPPIATIGGAPDAGFTTCSAAELRDYRELFARKFWVRKEFFLYVGGFDFRKNVFGTLRAFAGLPMAIRQKYDLIVACALAGEQRARLLSWNRQLAIQDSVILTGYISDGELRALYGMCRLFLFPSLYEGLGLPVLEALRCGAPVVASNRAAIPEVVGPFAYLADPACPESISQAMQTALEEPREERREERIAFAKQFSWEKTAVVACRALESAHPRKRCAGHRRRLAWVSPLPPAVSGIADYSAELLEELRNHFEIELVIDPAEPAVGGEIAQQHLVLTKDEFGQRHQARPYDLFVYQVGNSHRHVFMLDLMQRHRGLAVVHDFYLGGLVLPAMQSGMWPGTLAQELAWEGDCQSAKLLRTGKISGAMVLDQAPLNRRILGLANAVIVHSAWTWQRVKRIVDVPVAHVPLAVPQPSLQSMAEERTRLGLAADDYLIATLGFVGPAKRIPSLLQAVSKLPATIRQKSLILIVGYATEQQQAELQGLAKDLGIGGRVQFTGRVTLDDFAAYARAANVCVQLRYPTRGETSAALLRELAAGAACVISNYGSIAEVPDHIALKVRTPDHEVEDLAAALEHLYFHPETGAKLGEAAIGFVKENHSIQKAAESYAAMVELSASARELRDAQWTESACNALNNCTDPVAAGKLITSWASLRAKNQRTGRVRRGPRCQAAGPEAPHPTLPKTAGLI